ncbi:MAG: PEP-utilizing enzyme, partial [Candidatus Omnitrophica bacterium]|nr:PEP-utilizing enzyme [Candidatus Omnitrophota bacterium]
MNWIEPSLSDEGDGFIEGGSKRITLIKNVLSKFGFDLESEDYFARLDKDTIHIGENISIADLFIRLISMLSKFRGLDQDFHSLIFFGYPKNEEAINKIIEQWSEHILWGRFFLKAICAYNWNKNETKIITSEGNWRGEGDYTDKIIDIYNKFSPIIKDIINKELKRLNEEFRIDDFNPNVFELIPEEKPFGQIVIDYYLNQPIKEALNNNILVIDEDGVLHKNPNYQLLPSIRTLVRILDREDNLSSWNRCAYNIAQISDFTNFRWVGKIGRYDIEKGTFYLNDGKSLTVYIFRDFKTNKIDLAIPLRGRYIECNNISRAEILEKLSKEDSIEPTNLINKYEEFFSLLSENGYPIFEGTEHPSREDVRRIQCNFKKNIIPQIYTGIALTGLPIVQGCVSGKAIFKDNVTEPKDCRDKILVVGSVNPDDIAYLKECKGIVVRYGSALAHIFIIAHGLNKPVVILNNLPSKGWNIKYETFEEELGIYKGVAYFYRKKRRFESITLELDDVVRVNGWQGKAYVFKNEQIKNIVDLLDKLIDGKINIESFVDFIKNIKDIEVIKFLLFELLVNRVFKNIPEEENIIINILNAIEENVYLNKDEIDTYLRHTGENLSCYLDEYIEKLKKDIEEKTICITNIYEYLYRINEDLESVRFVYRIASLNGISKFDEIRREVYKIVYLKLALFKEDIRKELESIYRVEGLNLLPLLALKNKLEISGINHSNYISKVVNKLEEFKQHIDKEKKLLLIEEVTSEVYDHLSPKASKLGDLMLLLKDSDFKVPEGFIFTSKCYREFIDNYRFDNTSLEKKIKEIISRKDKTLKEIVEEIKALFIHPLAKELFKDLFSKEIEEVLKLLGEDTPKIVRSAALNTEDQRERSFAGMYESISWIFTRERLIEAILNVWASLFNEKVIEYLNYNLEDIKNIEDYVENASMDVIIQKMINSSKSAIIFSIDIADDDLFSVLICAGWGLGEGIERYSQDTDRITYDKRTGRIKTVIGYKNKKVIGNINSKLKEFVDVEDSMKDKEVFNNEEIEEIVRVTELIEQYYCYPVNIEIAIEGDKKYCIQVRDITDLHIVEGNKIYQEMREKFSEVDKEDLNSLLGNIFEDRNINWLTNGLFVGSIPIHELGHLALSKLQHIDVEFRLKDLFKGKIGVWRAPPLVRLAGILTNLVIGGLSLLFLLNFNLPLYISLPLFYLFITNIIQFILEPVFSLILKKGDLYEAIKFKDCYRGISKEFGKSIEKKGVIITFPFVFTPLMGINNFILNHRIEWLIVGIAITLFLSLGISIFANKKARLFKEYFWFRDAYDIVRELFYEKNSIEFIVKLLGSRNPEKKEVVKDILKRFASIEIKDIRSKPYSAYKKSAAQFLVSLYDLIESQLTEEERKNRIDKLIDTLYKGYGRDFIELALKIKDKAIKEATLIVIAEFLKTSKNEVVNEILSGLVKRYAKHLLVSSLFNLRKLYFKYPHLVAYLLAPLLENLFFSLPAIFILWFLPHLWSILAVSLAIFILCSYL